MLRGDVPFRIAVLASAVILAAQIAVHVAAGSGLLVQASSGGAAGVGVPFNLPDMLSYASWAYQAKLGSLAFSDLFTTEEHAGVFFNLYFLVIGLLSRVSGIEPLRLMELSSFLLGPAAAFAVLHIARRLNFDRASQAFAILFAIFGSGVSGLLLLTAGLGGGPLTTTDGLSPWLQPGADATYHDLFPLTALVFYPYHAAALVLMALIVGVAANLFTSEGSLPSPGRAAALGGLLSILGLVRPYEAVTLLLVFNLTALVYLVSAPRWPWRRFLVICGLVDLLAVPPVAYAGFMTLLPVWGEFANHSMGYLNEGAGYFLKGFGLLWLLALLGLHFAIKERHRGLCFVGLWAIVAAALLSLSPSYGAKLAGGSVLADGILAAYGVGRLLLGSDMRRGRAVAVRLSTGALAIMALTPIAVLPDIAKAGAPLVDSELLAAGQSIRDREGHRIPTVLTDLSAGAVLPGLFGERVYAGHWTLTPDIRAKGRLLRASGIETPMSGQLTYDRELLAALLRSTRADYLLLRRDVPAWETIGYCSSANPVWQGDRWIAVELRTWSCRQ